MSEDWQTFRLCGEVLHVRQEDDRWRLLLDEREAVAPHLDRAVAELLKAPSHMALRLALAILNAEPGAERSPESRIELRANGEPVLSPGWGTEWRRGHPGDTSHAAGG